MLKRGFYPLDGFHWHYGHYSQMTIFFSFYVFQIKAFGQVLWDAVVKHLNLVEADYFDLEFQDAREIQVSSSLKILLSDWLKLNTV